MNKKIHIITRGCQMNSRDSEFAAGILMDTGFRKAVSIQKADVVLFNSCSVRKHAEDRLFSNIAELKELKQKRPGLIVGLMGCTAQSYKDKALRRLPIIDFVCGPGNIEDLPVIIRDVAKNRCPIVAIDKVNKKREELFPKYRDGKFKAYVSISEGCNNFCSYCIVPYVRGRERSRDTADIIREVKDLASRGFKEITLLGQNVNSYHPITQSPNHPITNFVMLLERVNRIKGIERIRFMTSHPKDASIELFKAMQGLDKVCEHLHLPVQSGSDRMLKLMNRKYAAKKYLKLVEEYRKIVPGGSLTTDMVVGFPTETEEDFNKTVKLLKETGFDSVFTFKYSPRPPAKAAALKDDVPKEAKDRRLKVLMDTQSGISELRNKVFVGSMVDILVDGQNRKEPELLTGRTRSNKVAVFKGGNKRLIGRFVNVKIEAVTPYALKGRIISDKAKGKR